MSSQENSLYQLSERLDRHIAESNNKIQQSEDQYNRLINAQQENAKAISKLTESVSSLVEDTREVIKLYRDFQGAARVGERLQDFMFWLLKWGAIGAGIAACINWIITHFKS